MNPSDTHSANSHPDKISLCPSDETLAAFVDGTLNPLERNSLLAHLDTCERCFDAAALAMDMTEEPETQSPAKIVRGRFKHWPAMTAAASLSVAALLLFLFNPALFWGRDVDFQMAKDLTHQALIRWAKDGQPLDKLMLDLDVTHPEVKDAAETFRSAGAPSTVNKEALAAIAQWEAVLDTSPNNTQALEQLFSLQLLAKAYAEAVETSQHYLSVAQTPKARTYFYLANYLFENQAESQWVDEMLNLRERHPSDPYVAFYYAYMLSQTHATADEKKQAWQAFFLLDPLSPFAKSATQHLE